MHKSLRRDEDGCLWVEAEAVTPETFDAIYESVLEECKARGVDGLKVAYQITQGPKPVPIWVIVPAARPYPGHGA